MARASTITNISPVTSKEEDDKPKPTDFDNFVPWACKAFSVSADIIITRSLQKAVATGSAKAKPKAKRPSIVLIPAAPDSADYLDDFSSSRLDDENEERITVETFYDNNDNLVQLKFFNNRFIPRILMQVIGLAIPFHRYLTSIKIDSGLCIESLYELAKFLPKSLITEICLDGTFLSEANYYTLLANGKLKHLSLARCKINDVVVKLIVDQLTDPAPASRFLAALNLSNNRITDDGAKNIATMLRVNRQLRYLNLSGNMITDEGAVKIFEVFEKFPLQTTEVEESRAKYIAYLRKKRELIDAYKTRLQGVVKSMHDRTPTKKKMTVKSSELEKFNLDAQLIQEKAEYMAENELGIFSNPFSRNNTETIDGEVHCLGNNILCYLNLAYNKLTYLSVKKLHEVLLEQRKLIRMPKGLIKVVIEGNLLPITCNEYDDINHLLGSLQNRPQDVLKKKSFIKPIK